MFTPITEEFSVSYGSERGGETKLGAVVHHWDGSGSAKAFLQKAKSAGVRSVIVGIPEDIGPRANHGNGGAQRAWSAFLQEFSRLQLGSLHKPKSVCILGAIDTSDLQSQENQSLEDLRSSCEKLDERVQTACSQIVSCGLTPVIIGGGHNNCFPILKAFAAAYPDRNYGCINLDNHADFRPCEGRHSGNGFRYAFEDGCLSAYTALGINEAYNSEETLAGMLEAELPYVTMNEIRANGRASLDHALHLALHYIAASSCDLGLEIDCDSIFGLPASNPTADGFTIDEASDALRLFVGNLPTAYLHLPEGAPRNDSESRLIGRSLSKLVAAFLNTYEHSGF